jgi:hypothetical protein
MPVTCKRTRTVTKADGTEQDEEFSLTHFTSSFKPDSLQPNALSSITISPEDSA